MVWLSTENWKSAKAPVLINRIRYRLELLTLNMAYEALELSQV
jgi:hypothetical protein